MKQQRIAKRTIATLLVALMIAAVGCRVETKPGRFQKLENIGYASALYEDTATGEVWLVNYAGSFAADTWTKVDSP